MSTSVIALPVKGAPQSALAASFIALPASAKVFGLTVYNSKASAQFIQFHDSATLPADTAVPVFNVNVPASSSLVIDFGFHGMDFVSGVVVCNSSTAPTKTIGSADCQFFVRLQPL